MLRQPALLIACIAIMSSFVVAEPEGKVLVQDDFNRDESSPEIEEVGNSWGTNSRSRAQGVKQVDLIDGAMFIKRADVADHGVSVTHETSFKDASIQMKFKLGPGDDLGINIADMKEKSVHAGHICMARIRLNQVEIVDLKTGRMKLESRNRRLEGKLGDDELKSLKLKSRFFKVKLTKNEWHDLKVIVHGDEMTVTIDEKEVGSFRSPGIDHPTKSRLRLAVNKEAWVDDVKVVRLDSGGE